MTSKCFIFELFLGNHFIIASVADEHCMRKQATVATKYTILWFESRPVAAEWDKFFQKQIMKQFIITLFMNRFAIRSSVSFYASAVVVFLPALCWYRIRVIIIIENSEAVFRRHVERQIN